MPETNERDRLESRHVAASNAYRTIANRNAKLALSGQGVSSGDVQLERDALAALEKARRALLTAASQVDGNAE